MITTTVASILLVAQLAFAQADPLDVPQGGNLPSPGSAAGARVDSQAVSAAYGDLSVFILNVAAGNDGVSQKPDGEAAFRQLFAQPVSDAFPGLNTNDQQALGVLVVVDSQLHQAWPNLPVEQRLAVRDEWAATVQQMVSDAPCELFDAMARAQLLPSFGQYKDPNIQRLLQCWHDQPALTQDSQSVRRPMVSRIAAQPGLPRVAVIRPSWPC